MNGVINTQISLGRKKVPHLCKKDPFEKVILWCWDDKKVGSGASVHFPVGEPKGEREERNSSV